MAESLHLHHPYDASLLHILATTATVASQQPAAINASPSSVSPLTEADIAEFIQGYMYNLTAEAKLRQPFYRILLGSFVAVFVSAVIGNSLMLYAIVSTWQDPKSLNHRGYYLNLIVCDLLVATIILPATCADQLDSRWFLGEAACKLRHALSITLMCSSVFTLTCLSWLRSLGVSRTMISWLDRRRKLVRNELLTIVCIWLLAVVISIPAARVSVVNNILSSLIEHCREQFGFNNFDEDRFQWLVCRENWDLVAPAASTAPAAGVNVTGNSTSTSHISYGSGQFWYGLAILSLVCLMPLLSLTIAYFRICRAIYLSNRILTVHKRCEAIISSSYNQASDTTLVRLSSMRHNFSLASTCSAINRRKRLATSRRMFLLGVALVAIFASTWLPMQCLTLYRSTLTNDEQNQEGLHKLVLVFHLLALTNCLFNPYFIMSTHSLYRRKVRRLTQRLHCCCCGCRITWHFAPRDTERIEMQQL